MSKRHTSAMLSLRRKCSTFWVDIRLCEINERWIASRFASRGRRREERRTGGPRPAPSTLHRDEGFLGRAVALGRDAGRQAVLSGRRDRLRLLGVLLLAAP